MNLDLLEEKREKASRKVIQYQERIMRYYNQNVCVRRFRAGDWVLKKVNQSTRGPNQDVFCPNWEGLYRIIQATTLGANNLDY